MISKDKALALQAWLDGELADVPAREIGSWVETHTEARELKDELSATSRLLGGNELPRRVPEGREFYWSKIARGIQGAVPVSMEVRSEDVWSAWRRWLMPVGGLAMVALVAGVVLVGSRLGSGAALVAVGHEIETPINGMSSFAFRSESERMTVVWITFRE